MTPLLRLAIVLLVLTPLVAADWPVRAQSPINEPLLAENDLTYLGKFCAPSLTGAHPNAMDDGGHAIAYDSFQDELVVMGNFRYGNAIRMTVPTPSLSSCPRATQVGGWLDMQWRFPNSDSGLDDLRIGGFYPLSNGDMIISTYVYYDATASQVSSHVRRTAAGSILPGPDYPDLTDPDITPDAGLNFQAGWVSGWMLPIPSTWQSLFGGHPSMTGNGEIPINSRTSDGPALGVFHPADVDGVDTTFPVTMVMGYESPDHDTLGDCETGTIYNCSADERRSGIVWPVGTRSLINFHHICTTPPFYPGGGWACTGGGVRVIRALMWDATDLAAVYAGTAEPYDPFPQVWEMNALPTENRPIGATYDTSRGYIYLTVEYEDPNGVQPAFHVFEVNVAGGGGPTPPAARPGLIPNMRQQFGLFWDWLGPVPLAAQARR
jgi:hypothetical protein